MTAFATIHIAKKQLGLDEDTYRALLARVTGKDSLRAMTPAELRAVVREMTRLGFKVQSKTRGRVTLPDKRYARMIHALWGKCHDLGVVENGSRAALRAFCGRMVHPGQNGVAVDPDLLDFQQASPIIEALKKMAARSEAAS